LRGLAPEPRDRYASMNTILAALTRDTSARSRRGVIAAAGAVAVAVGALTLAGRVPARDERCRLTGDELTGAWDDARKAKVTASLGGGAIATKADALLDGYATRWRTMRVDACRATRIAGVQSEQLLDLRMACLARRRDQL